MLLLHYKHKNTFYWSGMSFQEKQKVSIKCLSQGHTSEMVLIQLG